MAMLPTGYVVGTNGVHNVSPTEQIGGAAMGITSATQITTGNPLTATMPIYDNTYKGGNRRVVVVQASGADHAYSVKTAMNSGTFQYNPEREFLINGYSTKVNGSASNILAIPGIDGQRSRSIETNKSKGYGFGTAFRAGYFSFTKVGTGATAQRTNWTTAPTSMNYTYKSTTNNSTDANDEANFVTYRSIPGELVFMGSGLTPVMKDYAAKTL